MLYEYYRIKIPFTYQTLSETFGLVWIDLRHKRYDTSKFLQNVVTNYNNKLETKNKLARPKVMGNLM